ncbi:MAG: hypothetical protein R3A79_10890 [Nannocystaceae bacterium]
MSRDDARWQALADAEALGEAISADDAAFRRAYEAEHPECAAESEAWGALLSALGAPVADENAEDAENASDDLSAAIVAAYRRGREVTDESQTTGDLRKERCDEDAAAALVAAYRRDREVTDESQTTGDLRKERCDEDAAAALVAAYRSDREITDESQGTGILQSERSEEKEDAAAALVAAYRSDREITDESQGTGNLQSERSEEKEDAAAALVAAYRSDRAAAYLTDEAGPLTTAADDDARALAAHDADPRALTGAANVTPASSGDVAGQPATVMAARESSSDARPAVAAVAELRPRRRWTWVTAGLAVAASVALVVLSRAGDRGAGGDTPAQDAPSGPRQAQVEAPNTYEGDPREDGAGATRQPAPPPAPLAAEEARIALAAPAGITVDGVSAYTGALLREGATIRSDAEACLVFQAPFASVCLSAGSEASLTTAHGGDRSLTLRRGALVATLDKLPEGHAFTVHTDDGAAARAVGTIFAVRVAADAPADVGVIEGAIEIRPRPDARPRPLRAGEHASFAGEPRDAAPLPEDLKTWSEGHADMAGLWRELDAAALINLSATAAQVSIDDHPLIDGDLALLVGPGEHRLHVASAHGSRSATITGDLAAPTTIPASLLAAPTRGKARAEPPPTPAGPTIDALRERASDARASRSWRAAADAYRELLDRYPAAPEAHNARYQLGDLLRRRLGQPAAALEHFDAYLERGGPLAAEARFGKVLALQQLGRRSDEAAAIADFLGHHPGHIEADKLRERQSELGAR